MKVNAGQAPSTLIPEYIGSDFDKVVEVADNIEYVKDVAQGIEGLPVISYIGDEPPTQPLAGAEWYCTTDGRTYVWYKDDDSGQWVESSPQSQITTFEQTNTVALTSKTTPINTVGKYTGKPVFNMDTKMYVYAIGTSTTDVWNNFDGTVAHTPV